MKKIYLIGVLGIASFAIGADNPENLAKSSNADKEYITVNYSICNRTKSDSSSANDGTYSPFILKVDVPIFPGSPETVENILLCWIENDEKKIDYLLSRNVVFITDETKITPDVTFPKYRSSRSHLRVRDKTTPRHPTLGNAGGKAIVRLTRHQLKSIDAQKKLSVSPHEG